MSITGYASSTINTYVASITFVHKMNGWDDPSNNFVINKILEGCRRSNRQPDSRFPITIPILGQLCVLLHSFCASEFEAVLFKATFLLAFFGFLRVGEFTAPSRKSDCSNILSRRDITMGDSVMSLVIRFSKTDQRGESTTLTIDQIDDAKLCPVKAMKDYLHIRPKERGPLFIHFGGAPVTRYQFNSMLKKGISIMGLNPGDFSPHSFRIGAATAAALGGVPIESIKNMGRWKSSSVFLYIRPQRIIQSSAWSISR